MYSNAILSEIMKNNEICIIPEVNLAERVRQLRESIGLSRREFAERLRSAKCTIWEWETGYNAPSNKSINKMCEVFGIDESYFK
jgi:transcriptional regulator with XRE-family HTH domain